MIIIEILFLFLFPIIVNCESNKVVWRFSDFHLTLDDFKPGASTSPDRGLFHMQYEELNSIEKDASVCKIRWKPPNIVNGRPGNSGSWHQCGWGSFRVRNMSSSFPMELEVDVLKVSGENNMHIWEKVPEKLYSKRATFKVLTNATGHIENLMNCNLHRHNKDVACNPTKEREAFTIEPKVDSGKLESFHFHSVTMQGFSKESQGTCSVMVNGFHPNGTFLVPGALPSEEEARIISSPTEFTCKAAWDCPKNTEHGQTIDLDCDNSPYTVVMHYAQDDQLRITYLEFIVSFRRSIGWAEMVMDGLVLLLETKDTGTPISCKDGQCMWSNIMVAIEDVVFDPWSVYSEP